MGNLLILRNWFLYLLQGLTSVIVSYGCCADTNDELFHQVVSEEPRVLTVEKEEVPMYVNDTESVSILSGNGYYTVENLDPTIVKVTLEEDRMNIAGLSVGKARVVIEDNLGLQQHISIEVNDKTLLLAGSKWGGGSLKPVVDTDYVPATEAIINHITGHSLANLLRLATLTFKPDGTMKMSLVLTLASGTYRVDGDYIILNVNKGLVKKYLQGDVRIPIHGDLDQMDAIDVPMDQTKNFDAKEMGDIIKKAGDPLIADAKVHSVIVNIHLKKK